MADGDGRAVLTLAEEVWRAAQPGETFDAAALQRDRAAARADLRQGAGRPLQSDLGAAQVGARLRSRTRRSTISRACSMPARTRCFSRGASCAWRSRISAWPIRRRCVVANAAKDAYDFLGSPGGRAGARRGGASMSRPRRNRTRSTPPSRRRRALAKEHGLADAAEDHPQRADQADEAARATAPATATITTSRRLSRARTISRRHSAGRDLLRAGRARLRARDQEAARLLAEAPRANGAEGGHSAARSK